MKKTRTKILAGVVLLAGVMLITGIVWAKATKTPVAGLIQVTPHPPQDAERWWIDDEGILHYRGLPADLLLLDGPLEGTGNAVVNLNIDLLTGNGDESGAVTYQVTWGDLSGTFEGRFSTTYTGGVGTGHGVYHGTGDLAGMKLMVDISIVAVGDPPFEAAYEGIILDPHGE